MGFVLEARNFQLPQTSYVKKTPVSDYSNDVLAPLILWCHRSCLTAPPLNLPCSESPVRFYTIPCDVCGGKSETITGFSPSTAVFPCQYHSASAPCSVYIHLVPTLHYISKRSVSFLKAVGAKLLSVSFPFAAGVIKPSIEANIQAISPTTNQVESKPTSHSVVWRAVLWICSLHCTLTRMENGAPAVMTTQPVSQSQTNAPSENCALLGYYAASSGHFLPTFSGRSIGPMVRGQEIFFYSWPLKMEQIFYPETSVIHYYCLLRNNPGKRSSHLLRSGSLKSHTPSLFSLTLTN